MGGDDGIVIEIAHEIELNSANDVYLWQSPSLRQ